MSLDTYAEHIGESIKSASLSIIINTPNSYTTPYVSNVKICYGKAVSKVWTNIQMKLKNKLL